MKTRQHTAASPWKIALSALAIAASAASGLAVAQTTDTSDAARQQRMDDALQNYRSGNTSGRTGTSRDMSSSSASNRDTSGMGPAARTEESIKRGARKTGSAIKNGAEKVGHAVAQGARKTGNAVKRATHGKAGTADPATTQPVGSTSQ